MKENCKNQSKIVKVTQNLNKFKENLFKKVKIGHRRAMSQKSKKINLCYIAISTGVHRNKMLILFKNILNGTIIGGTQE